MQLHWPVHLQLVRHSCHQAGGQGPLACQPWPASSCPPGPAAPWMDGLCAHLHTESVCERPAKADLPHCNSRTLGGAESLPFTAHLSAALPVAPPDGWPRG